MNPGVLRRRVLHLAVLRLGVLQSGVIRLGVLDPGVLRKGVINPGVLYVQGPTSICHFKNEKKTGPS